jgi:hypothetical protein
LALVLPAVRQPHRVNGEHPGLTARRAAHAYLDTVNQDNFYSGNIVLVWQTVRHPHWVNGEHPGLTARRAAHAYLDIVNQDNFTMVILS